MSDNDKVILELPRYIVNAGRLGSALAARKKSVSFYLCPNHLSDTAHVLEAEGHLAIPRWIFDKCGTGLRWEFLGDLPHRGFVVNWADNEFCISSEPYSDEQPDVAYLPREQTEWGDMQRRAELTPEEWERLNRPMRV